MPFLPMGAPHDILAHIEPGQWGAWADGAPMGSAPHLRQSCVVNKDFLYEGIQYRKGLRGFFVEEQTAENGTTMVKISIEGVTVNGYRDIEGKWVPKANVDVRSQRNADGHEGKANKDNGTNKAKA
ncbi:hypothetical protein P153DRAFT_389843 [Dothidotthia symphoricarpi CBS 119687]|uniref:Uncharacterized protein n=1 Tax=Dothidotthia symphoricarpi CBS 119687 TaxID=1392245 RepID=A0A6A5ZZJ4_9PLEO|nr:uncharacterized protein P153DRAFT_389843 [Dothidotthia symphoricarpi CBS 119687]KAF2124989.1 hypothetical protein P153DRAFT_389843 [Dothidotthia symphoricarpi CBS 119687]